MKGDAVKRNQSHQKEKEPDEEPDIALGALPLKICGEYGRAELHAGTPSLVRCPVSRTSIRPRKTGIGA